MFQDLRFGARMLLKNPGVAVVIIMTLALGIGANAAIFTLVRGVLIKPLVNRDEDRLIYIRQGAPGLGVENYTFSMPEIDDFKQRATTIAAFGDFSTVDLAMIASGGDPRMVKAGVVKRDLEQVHLTLALQGVPQRDPSLFSLQVFNSALGGGMSSRLFQEVREKRGLCYSISAFHAPYADTGMFGIYAGTDAGDVKELMRVVVDETAVAAGNIDGAEVDRAKAQIKVGLLMALESSGARARQLANQILTWGRPLPIEELIGRIDNVTVESARAAGSALIARARPAIAALGPSKGLESAGTIVESFKRRAA